MSQSVIFFIRENGRHKVHFQSPERASPQTLTVVILNPNHITFLHETIDDLGEPHVGLPISQPIILIKVHLSRVVVEEWPENGIGEPVVVTFGKFIGEVDRVTVKFFEEVLVYLFTIFEGDLESSSKEIKQCQLSG